MCRRRLHGSVVRRRSQALRVGSGTMKRRTVQWIAIAILTILPGVVAIWFWPQPNLQRNAPARESVQQARPSRAAFEQVRKGMTRAEVEALVGGPPGFYGP